MTAINIPTMEQLEKLIQLNEKRVVVLGSVAGLIVSPGELKGALSNIQISNYPLQVVVSRASSGHDYTVDFSYTTPGVATTFGSAMMPAIRAYESNGQARGGSEWIEAKTNQLNVNVKNNSEMEQTYDVVLYGVR